MLVINHNRNNLESLSGPFVYSWDHIVAKFRCTVDKYCRKVSGN